MGIAPATPSSHRATAEWTVTPAPAAVGERGKCAAKSPYLRPCRVLAHGRPPHTRRFKQTAPEPFAVIHLRPEDQAATAYNLVRLSRLECAPRPATIAA